MESTGCHHDEVEGELEEMMDRSVVEGTDYFGEAREGIRRRRELADAQEQVCCYGNQAIIIIKLLVNFFSL